MIKNTDRLIKELQEIDFYQVLEANPRRPFDNELTLKLFLEEVIRIIRKLDEPI